MKIAALRELVGPERFDDAIARCAANKRGSKKVAVPSGKTPPYRGLTIEEGRALLAKAASAPILSWPKVDWVAMDRRIRNMTDAD